jgi:osmotically-inducible protein OsmY
MKIISLYKSAAFAAVLGLMSSPILVTAADADREAAPGASFADGLMMAENRRDTDADREEGRRDDRGAMEAAGDFISDAALTTRVNAALAANRELSVFAISVDSSDGLVTLSGEVESDAQIALAERVVSDIDGVREVHNTLTSEES